MPPRVPQTEHLSKKILAKRTPPHPVHQEGYNLEKDSNGRGSLCFGRINGTARCAVRQPIGR